MSNKKIESVVNFVALALISETLVELGVVVANVFVNLRFPFEFASAGFERGVRHFAFCAVRVTMGVDHMVVVFVFLDKFHVTLLAVILKVEMH